MAACVLNQTGVPRLLLAGTLLSLFSGCGESSPAEDADREEARTPVAAVELARRDLSRHLSTSATVQPKSRIRLAARTTGTLEAVYVEEGDEVAAGDLLARLDTTQDEAELARARAQEKQARQEYRRTDRLRANELVSSSEYERQRTNLRVAESERQLWETRVAYGKMEAPGDTIVTARYIEPGEAVEAGETLFELTSMDQLVLRLGVSELDVVHLQEGQAVPVRLDARPGAEMDGSIRRIFPQADRSSRLIPVEVALPGDAFRNGARPGFLARVRMPIDERPDVLAVPASAIGEDDGEPYVFVIENDRLHHRTIERGTTRGQWTEVEAGLDEGEIVLATNPIDMNDGDPVRIVGWRG